MSDSGYHFKGETNTPLRLETGATLTSATNKKIFVRKPDGTEFEDDATVVDDTKLEIVIPVQDQAGQWKAQAGATLAPWSGRGSTFVWEVFENFATPD